MTQEPTNRRDFLVGGLRRDHRDKSSTGSTARWGEHSGASSTAGSSTGTDYFEHYSSPAMGCQFELFFPFRRYSQAASLALEIFAELDRLEDIMSIYRADSELSQINASPPGVWRVVSGDLFSVLELAQSISRRTEGAFDTTARPLTNAWGFSQRDGRIPDEESVRRALNQVDYRKVELDDARCAVRKNAEGTVIDLGAIGKGYALDCCRERLAQARITDCVIHGGQSSVIAMGRDAACAPDDSAPAESTRQGWTIGVSHPLIPDHRLGTILLNNRALGTSGSGRQGFVHAGRRYGHVIDPRTGWPPDQFLSVTVVSPRAAECDALATAFFCMTVEAIEAVCHEREDVGVLLVHRPERGTALRVQSFNLDSGLWQPNEGARKWHGE